MSLSMQATSDHDHTAKLLVEGGIKILYKGVWVSEILFDCDEITIGVMDPENEIYPDINLRQYRLDGGDPYISRRHAKFSRTKDQYFVEDVCSNNSTSLNNKVNVLNREKREIKSGDRIFISESIALVFQIDNSSQTSPDLRLQQEPKKLEDSKISNPGFFLEVEGQTPLFFKTKNTFTHIIELNSQEWAPDSEDQLRSLHIGRRSTEDSIYPDIDLWKFYFNDGDEYIARRHARIFEKDGKLYFQDISGKGSTWINAKDDEHRLMRAPENTAIKELQENDRIIISDSVVFVMRKQ